MKSAGKPFYRQLDLALGNPNVITFDGTTRTTYNRRTLGVAWTTL